MIGPGRRGLSRQDGQAIVLVVLAFTAIVAMAGLAVDGSRGYAEKRHLQKAADQAALTAGGQYYERQYRGVSGYGPAATIPASVASATSYGRQTAQANGWPSGGTFTIAFLDYQKNVIANPSTAGVADIKGVRVTLEDDMSNYFLAAIGIKQTHIKAQATAMMQTPGKIATLGPLLLHNWDSASFNVPRDSAYGTAAGQCATNPADGTTYTSSPDCRPAVAPTPVVLVPSYELTAPVNYPVPATTPFNTAARITYNNLHDPPSCQTGNGAAPPPYSACSLDHGAGFLDAIINGFQGIFNICDSPACANGTSLAVELSRRQVAQQASYDWSQQAPATVPPARAYPSMAYDPVHNWVVMFGGYTADYKDLRDTWIWQGASSLGNGSWTQICSSCAPPAREGAGMAYDSARGQIVMFGGYASQQAQSCGGCGFYNDTWTLNGTTWTQLTPATSPPARWYPGMAEDASHQKVVLFGGLSAANGYLGDTWTWDGTTWTERCGSPMGACPLPGRWETRLAFSAANGQVVLYGGDNGASPPYLADTWLWNDTTWTQISPTGNDIGARTNMQAALTTIPSGPAVLFYGGGDGTKLYNDTHILQLQAAPGVFSTLAPPHNPGASRSAGMAYDTTNNVMIMFGGGQPSTSGALVSNQTWAFTSQAATIPGVDNDYVYEGMGQRIHDAVSGRWANQDCSQPDGNTTTGVAPLTGDNPRLMRLPIRYALGDPATISGQINAGSSKFGETLIFCAQYSSSADPQPGPPKQMDGAYVITGYLVSVQIASQAGGTPNSPYLGQDVVVSLTD